MASDDFEPEYTENGQLIDFLEGIPLEATPEEMVRQKFLRILHFEYGYPKNVMRREVPIFSGASEQVDGNGNPIRADIIVYRSATACASRDQGQIIFVVECKRPERDDGYAQLVSYIYNTSAAGGVWTNDTDVVSYVRRTTPANALEVAPGFPRSGEDWDAVGRRPRGDLDRPRDVRGLLRLCHNKLHGIGIDADEEDLTMDMVRILLAKAQDEIGTSDLPEFYCTQEELRSAEGREVVAARVQKLFRKFADDNAGVFGEHERITVSAAAIAEVVTVLQHYAIMTRLEDADEWDLMGSAYEEYTSTHLKRQRGQFFTNRNVVNFMVEAAEPDSDVKMLDPAGGSGGFCTSVLRRARRLIVESSASETAREHQLANLRTRLFLVEISPRLVKIAKTAMLLNGDGHSGMTKGNTLGPFDDLDDWIKARCDVRQQPNLILTNPPFAGTGDGQVTDPATLNRFDLGHTWVEVDGVLQPSADLALGGCPPEMLFFERCLKWVAPGGVVGIVLPKSFLDTATYRAAREMLFREAQLLGVVNLHKNTFQPHTGVRTAIVFFRRYEIDEDRTLDYDIFMGISRKIGQDSEGRPIFRVGNDGETLDELDHDLDELLDAFRANRTGNLHPSEYRFATPRSELDETLNINPQRYLPHLNESLRRVQALDGVDNWTVTSLSGLASAIKIFKGPRLRTDNVIVESPDDGLEVEPYYTPSAVLQDKRDSVKWLDISKASDRQLAAFDKVRVRHGDLLVTRSGSIGRVGYIPESLDGAIVSDDAIRVRIDDPKLRAWAYAWLQSREAQNQLLRNEYGAVQQHLEPEHLANLLVPVPDDWRKVQDIVGAAEDFFASKEAADSASRLIGDRLLEVFGPTVGENREEDSQVVGDDESVLHGDST